MHGVRDAMSAFWLMAMGAIVLYAFFVVLDAFEPGQVWGLTIFIAVLAVLVGIHFIRVRRELARHGSSEVRRSRNKMRERRGF